MSYATVRDRIIALGFDYPSKYTAWVLGSLIREAFLRASGELPKKALDVKTSGAGSHCFAHYPEEFWPTMDEIISRKLGNPHPTLFGEGEV